MVIYVIRHSRPDIREDVCYGQSEVKLLQWHFERTIKRLQSQVLINRNTTLYSSPSKRCVQLARALSKAPCRIRVDHRLSELDFGDWEMKLWEDIDDTELLGWGSDYVFNKIPGGESYHQLYERVCDFWQYLVRENPDEAVVCTHGGVIKAILTHILDMPVNNSFSFQLRYGDTFRIVRNEHQPYLVEFLPNPS